MVRDEAPRPKGRAVYGRRSAPRAAPSGAPHRVRIVGGAWKRTPIAVADAAGLRPTPERVRATLFNWLAHLRPDSARLRGLDLFAGSGALGFELASRGAAQVRLVERDPRLAAALRALRERLGAPQVEVTVGDALAVARTLAPASVDVVFLDPPYGTGLLAEALTAVVPLLAADALVYAEDAAALAPQATALGYAVVRSGQAGRVHYALLARPAAAAAPRPHLPPTGDA